MQRAPSGLSSSLAARLFVALVVALTVTTVQAKDGIPEFDSDILPIFQTSCLQCHGQGAASPAGLDLQTLPSVLKGGGNGPVIVPGKSDQSVLFQRVVNHTMPPKGIAEVSDSDIQKLKKWIESGSFEQQTASAAAGASSNAPVFEHAVLPILKENCFQCHGTDTPPAGLDLRTAASVLKGSQSGPVIFKGSLEKSLLYQKVHSHSMPPPASGKSLTDDEIKTIASWIEGGAATEQAVELPAATKTFQISEKDRDFWAFRSPEKKPVPAVKNQKRVRTPVDSFILSKLEDKGLDFSKDASKETLLRRAYYDLSGLPPSKEEIAAFMADTKPDAYERLLDRLLASKHFGERWARHWLDVAGYTDVASIDNDLATVEVKEGMWRYRDYVIRSFNEDKPYNRFLTEQLAGDELVDWRDAEKFTPEMRDELVATGYLRTVLDTTDPEQLNRPLDRHDVLTRVVDNVSTGLIGLTVGCARCHNHKYDPIPQSDYYRLISVFATAYNPDDWLQPKNRFLPSVSKKEKEQIDKYNEEIDRPISELEQQVADLRRPHEQSLFEARLAKVPEILRADVEAAYKTAEGKRDAVQKYLVQKYKDLLEVKPEEVDETLSEKEKATQTTLNEKIATLRGWRRSYGKIQALWDMGPVPENHLLYRGNIDTPGPKVEPGFVSVLTPAGEDEVTRPPDTKGESSGRRLAFAQWLTSEKNPLTARVMVNKIWQHLFGKGIVATPENFGHSGIAPTHPELLDWMAVDFMQHDWKIKRIIKLVMMSTAYRQSSVRPQEVTSASGESIDPANDLYWRMNLRRADAEVIRDSILAVSGKLDPTQGGPAVLLDYNPDGLISVSSDKGSTDQWRRSIYLLARRNYPLTFLDNFDFPIMAINCTRRANSATPLQSLTLLNSDFVMQQAENFAQRVIDLAGPEASLDDEIRTSYLLAVNRAPNAKEITFCKDHLNKQTQRYLQLNTPPKQAERHSLDSLCQMLFASSEFLYID